MTFDELVRDTLREQAESVRPAPADLAVRVLARRARHRTRGLTAATVVTVVAVAAAVATPTMLDSGHGPDRHARHDGSADIPAVTGVESHPSQSPPRDRISAGNQVLAAYYSTRDVRQPDHDVVQTRTYSLLDPDTGRYATDSRWSDVVVAPGLRTAAVLEQALPARRVGILDLGTGRVTHWIPVPQGAAALDLSPDGSKLVVTTYDQNPNRLFWAKRMSVTDAKGTSYQPQPEYSRTGFSVIDLPSGAARWHALAPDTSMPQGLPVGSGAALQFNDDGTLLTELRMAEPHLVFLSLDGTTVPAPAKEKHEDPELAPAGLSPDGKLMAGDFAGEGSKTATELLDPVTGKRAALLRGQKLLAWVDDRHLIAWDIAPGGNEFGTRLVMVTVGSSKEVPLSGARHTKQEESPARWEAVFAHR
ncbi:hypothetical protein AB0399_38915 [Streptomyces sp. NPDC088194]|uniref:hypothetical protein n=1 Tax=Streptomyces sp. NPDC088194 TaxID=3154931 RepID=UPI00344E041F